LEVGPDRGPYRSRLVELIRHAKRRGMTTALMPTIRLAEPRGGEWRGQIVPDNWDQWWRSYQRMTDHFVTIAVDTEVDLYIIGSELLTTENQSGRWRRLIAQVRSRFKGPLTYSGNWDSYSGPTFWADLDLIALNGYFDLTAGHDSDHPPLSHLTAQWRQQRKQLVAYSRRLGKPLLMTEVGYPSRSTGLKSPWDYWPDDDEVADHAVQRAGYDAFFTAWAEDLKRPQNNDSPLAGIFFYEWDPYRAGEKHDTHYGVRGKPSYQLIKQRLREFSSSD